MGRPLRIPGPLIPRRLQFVRYRLIFVSIFLLFIHQLRLFFDYRDALFTKYAPTHFDSNFEELHPRLFRPDDEDAQFQDDLLAHRNAWKALGSGWEGKTFIYGNSVIKVFTPGRSPFRNCAPGHADGKWPTEIPASLYFGGSHHYVGSSLSNSSTQGTNSTFNGFLPVKAYFMAPTLPSSLPEWHLVTPLVSGGNLNVVAKTQPAKSYQDVDTLYRPAFNRLLRALEGLHEAGFCHDDIKPSNIFVEDNERWILGDLGNVRHVSHHYHSSRIWKDNNQLEDCRANDVLRILKSYLYFVRASSFNAIEFDEAFFQGTEPLSRLFWWTLSDAQTMSAAELRARSAVESPFLPPDTEGHVEVPNAVHPNKFLSLLLGRKRVFSNALSAMLRTTNPERHARWMALTWIFGVPEPECRIYPETLENLTY